jgi:hypothetical protein
MADDVEPDAIWDLGNPGASARAEYQRRLSRQEARRRARFGRYLAPVVGALAGPNPSTVAWERGGRGEEEVGRTLTRAVADRGVVLHDRAIPRSRANIDHIAVVPSGVWVIDTKRYRGRVERRSGWLGSSPTLFLNQCESSNRPGGSSSGDSSASQGEFLLQRSPHSECRGRICC